MTGWEISSPQLKKPTQHCTVEPAFSWLINLYSKNEGIRFSPRRNSVQSPHKSGKAQRASQPPSTASVKPFTYAEASEAR